MLCKPMKRYDTTRRISIFVTTGTASPPADASIIEIEMF